MTPDEAKAVLASAAEQAAYAQWADVDHLMHQVYTEGLLQGPDQGDAAYYLGLAYLNTQAWDSAHFMFAEASSTASTARQAEARRRLDEISRYDTATDTSFDGVVPTEAAGVLARAAPRVATVFAHQGKLTEAAQYADFIKDTGVASQAAGATALLAWIKEQQGADAMTADGTTIDEYAETKEAARSAFFSQDWARAHTLYLSILQSPQVGASDLAKIAYNAGQTELMLGMDAEARDHFGYAQAHGSGDMVEKATKRLAALDRHDAAEALVHELVD